MWNIILKIYFDLKTSGIDLIVVCSAILGTHFIKIFVVKNLQFYTDKNKGLINAVIALILAIIGSLLFTSFWLPFAKTVFISWIFGIGGQQIMQVIENKFFKKE
jgi:hypothetical protein